MKKNVRFYSLFPAPLLSDANNSVANLCLPTPIFHISLPSLPFNTPPYRLPPSLSLNSSVYPLFFIPRHRLTTTLGQKFGSPGIGFCQLKCAAVNDEACPNGQVHFGVVFGVGRV